jgi:hypothetical protein
MLPLAEAEAPCSEVAQARIETRTDAYGETKHFVAVSDEALKMDKTRRTASIAAEMAAHQGKHQGWSEDITHAAAFLAGVAVYDVWYGSDFDAYQKDYFPEKDLTEHESRKYIADHDFVTSELVGNFVSKHMRETDPEN